MKFSFKNISKLLLLFGLFIPLSSSFAAPTLLGDAGFTWAPPMDHQAGLVSTAFSDSYPDGSPSFLLSQAITDTTIDPTCASVLDSKCANSDISYQAVLPFCESSGDVGCVDSVGTIDSFGSRTTSTFQRLMPKQALNAFDGSPSLGIPSGSAPSIVDIPSAPRGGGSLYAVIVKVNGGRRIGANSNIGRFYVELDPVQIVNKDFGKFAIDSGFTNINRNQVGATARFGQQSWGNDGIHACVAYSVSESLCAQKVAFPADTRFFVKVRLNQLPTGWMHGRVSDPGITISNLNSQSGHLIDIQANPVAVPVVYKAYMYTEMPQELKSLYDPATGTSYRL
jgi:hypothetical protein